MILEISCLRREIMDAHIEQALKNVLAGNASSDEIELLKQLLASGQMKIGGSVSNSIIVLGNGNTVQLTPEALKLLGSYQAVKVSPGIFRNLLLAGIHLLPYDYYQRIENFLTEYLGNETQPVPFGGRGAALKMLNDWLENSNAPYFLLAAPAGRGKSALLVRWLDNLKECRNLALAFVPVSIRFGTNMERVFYASLAARLAFLHGDDVPASPETSTEVYRGLVSRYLSKPLDDGRTMLVVLDGIDEAGDWQANEHFMPAELPPSVRVLVSARFLAGDNDSTSWLRRLHWERNGLALAPSLEPLDKAGVADVLEKMGCPLDELGRKVDIVAELYRLSLGDPLLVSLYVSDLWEKRAEAPRLQPENLREITPGYKGYFEDYWWKTQETLWGDDSPLMRSHVQLVLNLLAGALGALTRADLIVLSHGELNKFTLNNALKALQRFVIGDGEKQGYTFSHPKLGQYFWDDLSQFEQEQIEHRFLDWSEQTLNELIDGKRAATKKCEIPSYVVYNYSAHLIRARQPIGKFLTLVQHQEWAQSWFSVEGAYGGYSQDVQRAWNQCKLLDRQAVELDGKAPYLGQQIRCALIEASLHSLAGNIPSKLIPVLLKTGIWNLPQTWVFIRQMPDPRQQAETIIALIQRLDDKQLLEALEAARAIQNEGDRARVLNILAQRLPERVLEDVLEAARAIQNEGDRARVLSVLAQRLPEVAREALEAARAIQNKVDRANILFELAQNLPEEALGQVLETARAILHERNRARVLSALAQRRLEVAGEALEAARATQNKKNRASILIELAQRLPEEALGQVLETVRAILHERNRAKALSVLAQRRPELAREALEAARVIQKKKNRASILIELAQRMPELAGEALEAAQAIQDEKEHASILIGLAQRLPEGALGQVLEAAQAIQDEKEHASILIELAQRMPEKELGQVLEAARVIQGEKEHASILIGLAQRLPEQTLGQILEAMRAIRDKREHARVLSELAQRLPELAGEALDAAQAIRDEEQRARALGTLAQHLPEVGSEALNTAQTIQNKWDRIRVLSVLAQHLPKIAGEALDAARAIQHEGDRAIILIELAQHLPEEELGQVLDTAQAIRDEGYRTKVLSILAQRMPEKELGQVLDAGRAIQDESYRVRILSQLTQRLPEVVWEALEVARAIRDNWNRARIMGILAQCLPEVAGEALYAARAIQNKANRAIILTELAQSLPEVGREALEAARAIPVEEQRASILIELAQRLPEGVLGDVLDTAWAVQDKWNRARILGTLAQRLPEVADEALKVTRVIRDEREHAVILSELAQHLPDGALGDVLAAALEIQHERDRARILSILAQRMPKETLEQVLDAARAIRDEREHARILSELAQRMPEVVWEALEAASAIRDEREQVRVFSELAQPLCNIDQRNCYWGIEIAFCELGLRTRAPLFADIAALMPVIFHLGKDEIGQEILLTVQDVSKWWK